MNNPDVTPARALGLTGCSNFRDAGGYRTGCGGRLHWRRLFRSGHLAALSDADYAQVEKLQLDLVIDLRRPDEQAREPSRLPASVRVLHAPINPGSQANALLGDGGRIAGGDAMFRFMCDINRQFVAEQSGHFAEIISTLLDSDAERILVHCSAGKDRTGFLVAVLQLAVGVPLEGVREDYQLSARYYDAAAELPRARSRYDVAHLSDDELLPLLQVSNAYLDAALGAIDELHGSVECYLATQLRIGEAERRELRRRFLVQA